MKAGRRRVSCVLASGGVESTALVTEALGRGRRVVPVYVRSGFRWERAELYWLRRILRELKSARLGRLEIVRQDLRAPYGRHWSTAGAVPGPRSSARAVFLPGRNVLALAAAAVPAHRFGAGAVEIGVLKGNPFGDGSPAFFRTMRRALSLALERPLAVRAPYRNRTKSRVVERLDPRLLGLTFSCIRPAGLRHCGRCNKCAERRAAFRRAGIPDPTRYRRS
jgi:7-cyano-7-deazaguanine synthase